MTEPTHEFYTARVEKPVGDGWETVFTNVRPLTGISARDAARSLLDYAWPVDIYDKNKTYAEKARIRAEVLPGTAEMRIVVEPLSHNRRQDSATVTIGEVRLGGLVDAVADLHRARDDEDAARQALKDARSRRTSAEFRVDDAARAALLVGVSHADVGREKRKPRPRKLKAGGSRG